MESYIVRIYRREESKPGNLLGTVETMGSSEKLAFTNRDELLSILERGDDCGKKPDERKTGRSHKLEADLADFLLQAMPVGIIVMNDKLNITFRNGEGRKFLERYGLPREVPRIGSRLLDAFQSARLKELFPGEVYIEKRLGNSTSKWLFKLHMIERNTPRIVIFIIEEAISNQLSMSETRLRYGLTRRETDVLRRVLRGLKTADIAEELSISGQTIKAHLSQIYGKIGTKNRHELMSIFISQGPGTKKQTERVAGQGMRGRMKPEEVNP